MSMEKRKASAGAEGRELQKGSVGSLGWRTSHARSKFSSPEFAVCR